MFLDTCSIFANQIKKNLNTNQVNPFFVSALYIELELVLVTKYTQRKFNPVLNTIYTVHQSRMLSTCHCDDHYTISDMLWMSEEHVLGNMELVLESVTCWKKSWVKLALTWWNSWKGHLTQRTSWTLARCWLGCRTVSTTQELACLW